MELEEFVKNTLVSITKGLQEANKELSELEGKTQGQDATCKFVLEPNKREKEGYVAFDVAVTVNQETQKSGGGKIKIAIASFGGEVDSVNTQAYLSRIKFHVMPNQYIG